MKKKQKSKTEQAWRKTCSDERWERRADRLMEMFSAVTVMLPSQITHLRNEHRKER
jgi:hypothetical protein